MKYSCLLFLFLACRQKVDDAKIKTIDLKYSVFTWNFVESKSNWNFYLADYLHIDTNGRFQLLRHDFYHDKPEYFNGILNIDLRNSIDSILIENKYFPKIKTDNKIDSNAFFCYDGYSYLLDYKLIGKEQTKIAYINTSSKTPKNILSLTSLLDTFIQNINSIKCDSFSIGNYLDTLKSIDSNNLPPPPIKPTVRFAPPIIKR